MTLIFHPDQDMKSVDNKSRTEASNGVEKALSATPVSKDMF